MGEDEELWDHFSECGEIDRVRVVRQNGMGKGFGFVSFKQRSSVDAALNLENSVLKGQTLRITKVTKQKNNQTNYKNGKKQFKKKTKNKNSYTGAERRIKTKEFKNP